MRAPGSAGVATRSVPPGTRSASSAFGEPAKSPPQPDATIKGTTHSAMRAASLPADVMQERSRGSEAEIEKVIRNSDEVRRAIHVMNHRQPSIQRMNDVRKGAKGTDAVGQARQAHPQDESRPFD